MLLAAAVKIATRTLSCVNLLAQFDLELESQLISRDPSTGAGRRMTTTLLRETQAMSSLSPADIIEAIVDELATGELADRFDSLHIQT